MDLVEDAAVYADPLIGDYVFKAVTEGLSYANLQTVFDIPCGKDMYYSRYRAFFKRLSGTRN